MEDVLFNPRSDVPVGRAPSGLVSWCVVTSDPTGKVRKPAGTIAYHVNGTQSWFNGDGTAAGWVQASSLGAIARAYANGAAGVLGAAVLFFDLADLASDTRGGWRIVFDMVAASASPNVISTRVNGMPPGRLHGYYQEGGAPPAMVGPVLGGACFTHNAVNGIVGSRFRVAASCLAARSGRAYRQVEVVAQYLRDPTPGSESRGSVHYTYDIFDTGPELVSFGIAGTVAGGLGATGLYSMERISR